jgi:hypothetical protein
MDISSLVGKTLKLTRIPFLWDGISLRDCSKQLGQLQLLDNGKLNLTTCGGFGNNPLSFDQGYLNSEVQILMAELSGKKMRKLAKAEERESPEKVALLRWRFLISCSGFGSPAAIFWTSGNSPSHLDRHWHLESIV